MGIASQQPSCLSTDRGCNLHDPLWRETGFLG